jgi:hypothetical protein
VLVVPLGIKNVVHGDHGVVFLEGTGTDTSEFLHVRTTSEEVTEMDTEGTDIGSSFAGNPEDTEISLFIVLNELQLVDLSDSQFLLDSGNQRGSLETGTGELVEGTLDFVNFIDRGMELEDTHVFFTGGLLGLDKSGGVLNADNEASSDLGIESTTVSGLLDFEDLLDPGNDLMGRGVGGLIEVDNTVMLELVNGSLVRRESTGEGSEMAGFHVEFLEVLLNKENESEVLKVK